MSYEVILAGSAAADAMAIEPAPQIIEVPAIVTSRTSYVPDTVNEVTDLVHAAAERHAVPIEHEVTKGSTGLWSHTYKTALKIGSTSVWTLTILASDNKRRAFILSVGKETLVCSNGMTRFHEHYTYKTRHTAWIRTRIRGAIDHAFERSRSVAHEYALAEERMRSIEMSKTSMHDINYQAVIDGAWNAETARAIHKEITNPTYAEFAGSNLYAWQERVTTALRPLADRPQAWREAAIYLDQSNARYARRVGYTI